MICRDRADYVKSWEEFRFIPGVKAALCALREAGVTVLIITNQSVINRGIVTREALDSLHRKMIRGYRPGRGRNIRNLLLSAPSG